jgi:DNA invertase Pin-like site-specific DNA recombinase
MPPCHPLDATSRDATGKTANGRPELEKAIDELGTGDVLVLVEWDRCTRSMIDEVEIIDRVHKRGAAVNVALGP